jgi:murein DD-endopeptidase MepM/ murein hydrolase activator NlpD
VSEIRFHSGDPARRTRSATIGPATGLALAAGCVLAGTLVVTGLAGAPELIVDLVRSADRLALRETTQRGAEALASVGRRSVRLSDRVATDELFLARIGAILDVPLPPSFPSPPKAEPPTNPSDAENDVTSLARRVRVAETFRRRLAALPRPLPGGLSPVRVPSRSPVEPSSAVPIETFGLHSSPLTHRQEFFPGLALAAPAGTPVVAPAAGTIVFAGPAPKKSEALWRRLGTILVVAHDARTRTVFGHLDKLLVRKGQRVGRGTPLARVGQSGFAPTPYLHYEVRRLGETGFLPLDPRLFILDVDWLDAADVRMRPAVPPGLELPPSMR